MSQSAVPLGGDGTHFEGMESLHALAGQPDGKLVASGPTRSIQAILRST